MKKVFIICLSYLLLPIAIQAKNSETDRRYLQFSYIATVNEIPTTTQQIRLWLPYPRTNEHQIIDSVQIESPYQFRIGEEQEYGNSILYIEANNPKKNSFSVKISFNVLRKEFLSDKFTSQSIEKKLRKRLLEPDQLVPIDGKIRKIATSAIDGKKSSEEKSRAIYDYVTELIDYDKSGSGWGRGDANYACDIQKGNCTDFHSLIIGMTRAEKIPSVFKIGFPLPGNQSEGEIGGYHCWAELYIDEFGWVPIDSSEASKHPEKHEYFYGNLDVNRIFFTKGRDLILEPPQNGKPLNFFIYPYAEIDGKIHSSIEKKFYFKELPLSSFDGNTH